MSVIVRPQYLSLDTSSLIQLSEDYWCKNQTHRLKAKRFINHLKNESLFIALTKQHIYELLQHRNQELADSRIAFLKQLPLIAWVRPFDDQWFVGGFLDIMSREIDAFYNHNKTEWREIIPHVRESLWETGTGADMFGDHNRAIWDVVRENAILSQKRSVEVASIARIKHNVIQGRKLSECNANHEMLVDNFSHATAKIRIEMLNELKDHADKRLENKECIAVDFAHDTEARVLQCASQNQSLLSSLLDEYHIPENAISDNMTVTEFGNLATYSQQLSIVSKRLSSKRLTVLDIPIGSTPSQKLQSSLVELQNNADKVSGSDIGDSHIAACLFYADFVQVDRRTHHYLNIAVKRVPCLRDFLNCYIKVPDYSSIMAQCLN